MATHSKPGGLPTDFVNMYKNPSQHQKMGDDAPPAAFVVIAIMLGVIGLVTVLNGVYLAAL